MYLIFSKSLFVFQKHQAVALYILSSVYLDVNLSTGDCSMTYQMPSHYKLRPPINARWVYTFSNKHHIFSAMCHTCYGKVPGFYWGGRCYYEYGHRLRHASRWSWVGTVYGHNYLDYNKEGHTCAIFGGYQYRYCRPLFLCMASWHVWLVPGKLDPATRYCWFLNTYTRNYYSVVAR